MSPLRSAGDKLCFQYLIAVAQCSLVDDMCFKAPAKRCASRYLIYACALWWLSPGNAQEPDRDIPSNAHYSAGEQGWACNRGFTQVAGLCMEDTDVVSGGGAFEFSNGQWRCRSDFHRAGKFCEPGVAPAHAAYVRDGDHWECDWGFQKTGSQCEEIKPPPHGYLEASGHDWVCFPGFERVSDQCVPTQPPASTAEVTTTPLEEQAPKR